MPAYEQETAPLIGTDPASSSVSIDEDARSKSDEKIGFFGRLDMVPSVQDKTAFGLVIAGLGLFVPLTWYMVFSNDLKEMGWFAYHPPMQSLSLAALFLGITPLQPPPTSTSTRQSRLKTHQTLLLVLSLPLMLLGTAAMWWNKHVHAAPHFTTWHSWFGVATVVWMVVQALVGGASVWFGGKAFGGGANAKRVYKYHRLSGYLLVVLAILTAHLAGGHATWSLNKSSVALRVVAFYIGLVSIFVGVELRIRTSKMKFA